MKIINVAILFLLWSIPVMAHKPVFLINTEFLNITSVYSRSVSNCTYWVYQTNQYTEAVVIIVTRPSYPSPDFKEYMVPGSVLVKTQDFKTIDIVTSNIVVDKQFFEYTNLVSTSFRLDNYGCGTNVLYKVLTTKNSSYSDDWNCQRLFHIYKQGVYIVDPEFTLESRMESR